MLKEKLLFMLNNLYTVTSRARDVFTCKLCDKEHPIFKAHFPGHPLLPGFVLIDMCEIEFSQKIRFIKKISFLEEILPKDELEFVLCQKKSPLHVEVRSAGKIKAVLVYGV